MIITIKRQDGKGIHVFDENTEYYLENYLNRYDCDIVYDVLDDTSIKYKCMLIAKRLVGEVILGYYDSVEKGIEQLNRIQRKIQLIRRVEIDLDNDDERFNIPIKAIEEYASILELE